MMGLGIMTEQEIRDDERQKIVNNIAEVVAERDKVHKGRNAENTEVIKGVARMIAQRRV
jgi:hypothetical protein